MLAGPWLEGGMPGQGPIWRACCCGMKWALRRQFEKTWFWLSATGLPLHFWTRIVVIATPPP